MDESIGIGNSSLAVLFFQVEAGSEFSIVKKLREQGYTDLYKAFGHYDIVSLFDVNNLEDKRIYTSCEGVKISRAITAYNFVSTTYQSPDIAPWSNKSPIIGFIFLELDKWFYTPGSGEESSLAVYERLISFILGVGEKNKIDIAIYGGYGRSELYLIVKTSSIEDIWKVTNACRNLQANECLSEVDSEDDGLPIFVRTRTIPCISYNCIEHTEEDVIVEGIEGSCSAAIAISCYPGFENYIKSYFPNNDGFSYTDILGHNDGLIYTTSPIETKKLVKKIIQFRQKWDSEHNAPMTTNTFLQNIPGSQENLAPKATGYRIENEIEDVIIPKTLQVRNPRLANRIKNVTHNINSYFCNRTHQIAVGRIRNYLKYIRILLSHYADAAKTNDQYTTYSAESLLLEATETIETGLAQRVDSSFDSINKGHEIPLPFGDGIFASLVAIEHFIDFIFEAWSEAAPDYNGSKRGSGFPTFNDSFGFLMRWGETFNLPLVALYDPCDSRGNWLTLTHEISHSIYIRLNIGNIHEDDFENIRKENFSERAANIEYDDNFIDQVFELFAHWYDYYHFYNEDFDSYLTHVWSSWLLLPVVHVKFSQYLFRSLFVFFIHNQESLNKARIEGTAAHISHSNDLWNQLINKLRTQIDSMPAEYIKIAEELKKKLLKLYYCYYPIMEYFEKYKNDLFKESINAKYQDLNNHIAEILNGKMIPRGIDNPYSLVKGVISKKLDQKDPRTATALIMSLKNHNYFYVRASESNGE